MTKTEFLSSLLSSAREICCRAVDNLFKNKDIISVLDDLPEVSAMLDVVDQQRIFALKHWNCFMSCLHLLKYLRENYFSVYLNLLHDTYDFILLDAFVGFYSSSTKSFV